MTLDSGDAGAGTSAGKVAVVTGAASGIGLALARRFASEGMTVAMVDRNVERLHDAAAQVGAAGPATLVEVEADVADGDSMAAAADTVAAAVGDVHVLCNNAGIIRPGRMWELSPQDWSSIMDVNVGGVVNGIRAFVPRMLAHGQPCHVVNTASAAGLFSAPAFGGYCTSKAAVIAVSEALAADIAQLPDARLVVSVLCPGSATSNLFRDEVDRRGAGDEISDGAARAWAVSADPNRTDQMDAEIVADAVWTGLRERAFWIVPMQLHMRAAALARLRQLEDALRSSSVPEGLQPSATAPVLAEYYARVDGATPASALELVAADLHFCLARPEARIAGSSRDELAAFIATRAPLSHRLLRTARDGDVEFALGQSVDGDTVLGAFVAAMRIDASGRIGEYRATFFPET